MSRNLISKVKYPEGYDFKISYCSITVSYVENRYLDQIRKNPKLLTKYEKQLEPFESLMKLDKNNLIPGKDVHDRKLTFLLAELEVSPGRQNNNTFWISDAKETKVLTNTKQRN
jgi:hypothetical protein